MLPLRPQQRIMLLLLAADWPLLRSWQRGRWIRERRGNDGTSAISMMYLEESERRTGGLHLAERPAKKTWHALPLKNLSRPVRGGYTSCVFGRAADRSVIVPHLPIFAKLASNHCTHSMRLTAPSFPARGLGHLHPRPYHNLSKMTAQEHDDAGPAP